MLCCLLFFFSTYKASTSFLNGADDCAPNLVTDMADALHARATASSILLFSDKATTTAALNTSPAAVVSTASTGITGTDVNTPSCNTNAPFLPNVIITVSTETKDFSYFKELHEKGLPIVFFDRIVDEIETHKVIVDNFKGAYDTTVHLIKCRYRNIAAVANSEQLSITKERLAGYKTALSDNGIAINESLIKYCWHGGMIFSEVEEAVGIIEWQAKAGCDFRFCR